MAEIIKIEEIGGGKSVLFKCEYCGKIVRKSKAHFDRVQHNFCSNKCKGRYFSAENSPHWEYDRQLEQFRD